MGKRIKAVVTINVTVAVSDVWNDEASIAQVRKQATHSAVSAIRGLVEGKEPQGMRARIVVSTEPVQIVINDEERSGP